MASAVCGASAFDVACEDLLWWGIKGMSGMSLEAVSVLFEFHSRALGQVPLKGVRFYVKCRPLHVRAREPETLKHHHRCPP